ncbi:MAG: V-type ATP synthase subunit F [Nitrososphaeria archaeon]
MSVVALGDQYFVTALRLAGVDQRKAHDIREAERIIDELLEVGECKVLIVPEELALKLKKKREDLFREQKIYPVFAIVPGFGGAVGERVKEIHQLISQAVGVKLKLGED